MSLTYFKNIFICLFVLLLLQSCTEYQKKSVSIQDASVSKKPVLVIRKDDTRLTLKKIILQGSTYYGMLKENGQIIKIPIVESDVKTIRMLDQANSLWGTVGILMGGISILGIISFSILFYDTLSPTDFFI
jgi:hypothetical protein